MREMKKTDTRYRVTGMDCSACAAKIEAAARSIAGVLDAKVWIASQEMNLRTEQGSAALPEVERSITGLGYRLARIDADKDDDKEAIKKQSRPCRRRCG
jgi:cation transport ATPase